MLTNTSRATTPRAVHPANAEPHIAPLSVRLRQLHVRTWAGVSAELFGMHAADRRLVEHPSDTMVVIEVTVSNLWL